MKNIRLYPIVGSTESHHLDTYKGWDIFDIVKEKINSETSSILHDNIIKHKKIIDLSSKTWHQVIEILLRTLWITADTNNIKKIGNVAVQIRKILKDIDATILEEIDSPDFIIPFMYLYLWFNTDSISHNGKRWINSLEAFAKTIHTLITQQTILFSGFLCAQREHESIEKDWLVKEVPISRFTQSTNILRWIAENMNKSYSMEFFHVHGDMYGMNAIFPTIFMKYLQEWRLSELSTILDNQFDQMKKGAGLNTSILSVSKHVEITQKTLIEKYGNNWWNISLNNLELLADWWDKVAEIAFYMTLPSLQRFWDLSQVLQANITTKEIEQWINEHSERLGSAIGMFFDSKSLAWKALYETMFYLKWWEDIRNRNGIGIWFDRDHDIFQTSAFSLWYDGTDSNKSHPLLYGRRTGNQPGSDIKNLTFRQFWFNEWNDIPD